MFTRYNKFDQLFKIHNEYMECWKRNLPSCPNIKFPVDWFITAVARCIIAPSLGLKCALQENCKQVFESLINLKVSRLIDNSFSERESMVNLRSFYIYIQIMKQMYPLYSVDNYSRLK